MDKKQPNLVMLLLYKYAVYVLAGIRDKAGI